MKFVLGIIIGIALGIVVVIFVAQNSEVVDISFLAWTLTMSRAIFILIILIFGVVIGWLIRAAGGRRRVS